MNEKKNWSALPVLALLFGAAYAVGSLLDILLGLSPSMGMCAVLLLEMGFLGYSQIFRRGNITTKSVMGAVFIIVFSAALLIGLIGAIPYVIAALTADRMGTSFPWYTGFAFAFLITGPVLLITGIAWTVMHLRERKRNVKDIRLLTQLLLIGTAFWALIWTVLRIHHVIVYPNSYGHPWHASFIYAFLYFGPMLILEGCGLYLLLHFEKKLTSEDMSQTVEHVSVSPISPIRWNIVISDAAVILIPLIAVAVLILCLWESGYHLWNLPVVLCSTMNVCLLIGMTAWVMYVLHGPSAIHTVSVMTWILTGLTPVAAAIWGFWYQNNCLDASGLYAENLVYTLGLGFFGPIMLGEGIMTVLLSRAYHRIIPEKPAGKYVLQWLILPLLALVLAGQFSSMEYHDEIPVTVTHVTNRRDNGDNRKFVDSVGLTFESNYDVSGIYDWNVEETEEAIFFRPGTRWEPLKPIGNRTVGYNLYPEESVQYIYVYEPGAGYKLILVRNQFTGDWECYK